MTTIVHSRISNRAFVAAVTAAGILFTVATAHANPLAAEAASSAVAGSLSQSGASSTSKGGTGFGGDSVATSGGNSQHNDSTSYGGALAQAPTALSLAGICGKGNRFLFGALEWSDYSSKCFNYSLAIEAESRGDYERANEWVKRADDM